MFACEHAAVAPDLLCLSKGITGGYLPLSAVLARDEIYEAFYDDDLARGFLHSHSYTGNALACRAALAVLDAFEEDGLVERAGQLGDAMRSRMETWQERWPQIGDVRGLGAMLAIELVRDPATKEPAADTASAIVDAAAERGLLLMKSGIYSNCIRVLTPLTLTDAELDEALGVWEASIEATLG
jgi:4-aminobutyrate aminotransferase/(S)-3-amino-2-methylpropionate transaminase